MAEVEMVDIPVNAVGESYGRFRLIHPGSEAGVLESMRQFGQLLPVVVVEEGEPRRYELIDGFKRLRACRKLGSSSLRATVLTLGERPVKAAILQLNWKARSIREMEEAMIVHSLHREDKLSQVEIAFLLGRHKSWVCRRISLVEKLAGEVVNHLKLGLITPGHGRELTRLPRGNQEKALETIIKHRLCCRETGKLVALLLERPGWEHESILHLPLEILDERSPPRSRSERKAGEVSFEQELRDLEKLCKAIAITLDVCVCDGLSPRERQAVVAAIESVANVLRRLERLCAPRGEIPTP